MPKQVQRVGGNATGQNQFVGAAREITIDTSNQDIRIHDGITPGGHPVLSRDNSDARYQARSVELDGLLGFEPQDKGVLVRLGPSSYTVRQLAVNPWGLVIENPRGQAGNPLISLAPTITSNHTFSGSITFSDRIIASDGITGDTYGNHAGNITGNLVGDVTGNLIGNASGNHTGSFAGNVNVVGGALQLENNQIPSTAINGLAALIQANGVFTGMILMWSGEINTIPSGWYLCDGTNGTPDLRGRFAYGAGGIAAVGSAGGDTTHTHTATTQEAGGHTHGIVIAGTALTEAQLPAHKHGGGLGGGTNDSAAILHGSRPAASAGQITTLPDGASSQEPWTSTEGGSQPHAHTASSDAAGIHTHGVTTGASSSLPPYLALAYIMKG